MHKNAYKILSEIEKQYNLKLEVWLSLLEIFSNMSEEQQAKLTRGQVKVHF
jgi:hypothetical protein